MSPFYLKLYNQQNFETHDQIYRYIETRTETLERLVTDDPQRDVEVSISLQDYTAINDVWKIKQDYNLDIDQMTAHLFIDDKRHSVMFVGDPEEPDDVPVVDFDESVTTFEGQLRALLPEPVLEEKNISLDDVTFRAAWIRGTLPATSALKLVENSSVMLVDPISDMIDAYADQATEIRVVQVPHLLAVQETVEELQKLDTNLVPLPTPAPLEEEK